MFYRGTYIPPRMVGFLSTASFASTPRELKSPIPVVQQHDPTCSGVGPDDLATVPCSFPFDIRFSL
jgi:hypothetical protein